MCWTSVIVDLWSTAPLTYLHACREKCHTSKLILRISWINYVLDKCHRWFTKRGPLDLSSCLKWRIGSVLLHVSQFWGFRVHWVWRIGSVLVHVSQLSCFRVRWVWRIGSVLWKVCECAVNGLWVLLECSVRGLWMLCECSVNALWVLWMLCECSVGALWMLCEGFVSALWKVCAVLFLIYFS